MLDVIHVLYEEDATPLYENHIEIKDKIRATLYPMLYKRPYLYGSTSATTTYGLAPGEDLDSIPPLPEIAPDARVHKPYVPPTNPEDLAKILGSAPLA